MDREHPDEQREKVAALVGKFGTAMLTTVGEGGRLVSRPMTPLGDRFDGRFVFATEIDNPAVAELHLQPQANVSMMHEGDNHFLSASGRARVDTDRALIARYWSPALDAFFKGGKDDPRVCLIVVEVDEAAYWDGPGNMLTKLAYFATVAVTGDHGAMSDSGNVRM